MAVNKTETHIIILPLYQMSPYATRPSNTDKHPGHIVLAADATRKCRSPVEMAEVRREQEAKAAALQ